MGAVEAVEWDVLADALLEAGEPAVVPHLGGVVVGFGVVERAVPAEREGGDLGGEAAVFGPAVRDAAGVFEGRVPQVPPGDPGRERK